MKKIILLMSIFILSFSCSSDDSESNEEQLSVTFLRANINGESLDFTFNPNNPLDPITGISSATLANGAITGEDFTFVLGGVEATTITNTTKRTIGILFSFNESGLIAQGASFTASNFNLTGLYTLEEDPGFGPIIEADTLTTNNANLTISDVDAENETISGTFSFTAFDGNINESFVVTNGVFNNVPYTDGTN